MDLLDGVLWVLRGLYHGVAWLFRVLWVFDFVLAPVNYVRRPYTCTECGEHYGGPPAQCRECGNTRFAERSFW
ncbi:hypothetical protein [Halorubellus litoreus]|uniref:Zinc-ribbon domain-containing protein n=1 Tax=Halorubellus litoreus TaxID=755308 RepID=A0ABD5VC90_9EURY